MFPQSTSASDLHRDECGSLGSCEPPLAPGPACQCRSRNPQAMLDMGLGELRGTGTLGTALVAGTAPVPSARPAQGSWGSPSVAQAEPRALPGGRGSGTTRSIRDMGSWPWGHELSWTHGALGMWLEKGHLLAGDCEG